MPVLTPKTATFTVPTAGTALAGAVAAAGGATPAIIMMVLAAGIITTIITALAATWPDLARQRTYRQIIGGVRADQPLRPAEAAQLLRAVGGGREDSDPRR
jgi:hypothetical protein